MIFTTVGVLNGCLIAAMSLYLKNIISPEESPGDSGPHLNSSAGDHELESLSDSKSGYHCRDIDAKCDIFLMLGCFITFFSAYGLGFSYSFLINFDDGIFW